MNPSIESLTDALAQERKAKEKLEKTYIRKLKKIEKNLLLCEQTRDNYNTFYLKSIESLKEKQSILDQRNQELSDIKNSLSEQNIALQNNQKELEKLNKRLNTSAYVDGLTGLFNRKSFDEAMKSSFNEEDTVFSLFFIDLDGFKSINDTFGHDAGDHLLKVISLRLQSVVRGKDRVFRLGGDEFVIIIHGENKKETLKKIAFRIIDECSQDVHFLHVNFHVSASIGIARYPTDYQADRPEHHLIQIRKYADAALYRAKSLGKNQYYFFNPDFSKEEHHKDYIGKAIQETIASEDIDVHFQAQFSSVLSQPTNLILGQPSSEFEPVSAEALLRWNNEYGIKTEELITWTDQLNLTKDIDLLVFKKVCQMLNEHPIVLEKLQYMAVNFCSDTFASPYHVNQAIQLTQEYGIAPHCIMIELTERVFLSQNRTTQNNIVRLEEYGFKLGLDDFGTGYSSLECLNRINFDKLKIDKSFARDVNKDRFNKTVIYHITAFAKDLGMNLLVEGVETCEQLRFLQSLGVQRFQGYFFTKPIPQDAFIASLCPDQSAHEFAYRQQEQKKPLKWIERFFRLS